VTFGGKVQVQLGNGTNTLNLAATAATLNSGGIADSLVVFNKRAVFDGQDGTNTNYVALKHLSGVAPKFKNF
jgi:hypothetical protein